MDDNLSDVVRDSKLRTRYEKPHTIHLFDDPDSPPFSARRREQWKKDRTIGHGGQGRVVLQTCTGGSRGYTQRAVKMIPLQEGGRRRYLRELEAILKFSHDKVCSSSIAANHYSWRFLCSTPSTLQRHWDGTRHKANCISPWSISPQEIYIPMLSNMHPCPKMSAARSPVKSFAAWLPCTRKVLHIET
jgi:hypothetical protein